jgi:RHS repeat-associated protein
VEGHLVQQVETIGSTTTTTRFAVDASGNTWADLDGSSNLLVRYLRDDSGTLLTRTVGSGANAGVAVYLTDRLGSVRDIANWSAAVLDHIDYSGFGVATESNQSVGDYNKYDSYHFVSPAGMYLVGARTYDPSTGRWGQIDPIGFDAGQANLYKYAGNDPTNAEDPSGLIGLFLEGAGVNGKKSNSVIYQLYQQYNDTARYYRVPVLVEKLAVLRSAIAWALEQWGDLTEKEKKTEQFDLFGYSRGAIYAIKVAQALKAKDIPVRLLVTIDAVPTYSFVSDFHIPDNVKHWVSLDRALNYTWGDSTIFLKGYPPEIGKGNRVTKAYGRKYELSHQEMGFDDGYNDLSKDKDLNPSQELVFARRLSVKSYVLWAGKRLGLPFK